MNELDAVKKYDPYIEQLMKYIHPTVSSQKQRLAIFEYISNLLDSLGLKTYLFGSVALKTYIPDGDIDISVFNKNENDSGYWYSAVCDLLQKEQMKKDQKFNISDISFINAEVKLVKCLVDDIPIDLTGHQVGGLSTLCLLEDIDRVIEKNHLFKKSIILVKAWCYYESRIHGSHHNLMSTYCITTLLIYLLNVFYDELHTPAQVLYKFLDYYSTFDWDHYGISVCGPVKLTELTESPPYKISNNSLVLKMDSKFFNNCKKQYLVQREGVLDSEKKNIFYIKYMNVIDPLRDYNNLGRSVSKNHFLRIKRAFAKGLRTLKEILESGKYEQILSVFFKNTWMRNKDRFSASVALNNGQPLPEFKTNLAHASKLVKKHQQKKDEHKNNGIVKRSSPNSMIKKVSLSELVKIKEEKNQ